MMGESGTDIPRGSRRERFGMTRHFTCDVIPGLDPGIHVFDSARSRRHDVDGRVKPGHDGVGMHRRGLPTPHFPSARWHS